MSNQYDDIPKIVDLIKNKLQPYRIILFGSCARRCITKNSDIDICVVLKRDIDIKERAKLRADLLLEIIELTEYEVDIIICGQDSWEKQMHDRSTFVGKIYTEGKVLYG